MSPDLIKLNNILNNAGMDNARISRGVTMTGMGYHKLATIMRTDIESVRDMIEELMFALRDELVEAASDRFGYEEDVLGNVTLRDLKSGATLFLRGAEAAEALKAIGAGDEQRIIADLLGIKRLDESVEAPVQDDSRSFNEEMRQDRGTLNFPWSYEGRSGFGVAEFKGAGSKFSMTVISVRDMKGQEIKDADGRMKSDLAQQAYAFIGDA